MKKLVVSLIFFSALVALIMAINFVKKEAARDEYKIDSMSRNLEDFFDYSRIPPLRAVSELNKPAFKLKNSLLAAEKKIKSPGLLSVLFNKKEMKELRDNLAHILSEEYINAVHRSIIMDLSSDPWESETKDMFTVSASKRCEVLTLNLKKDE